MTVTTTDLGSNSAYVVYTINESTINIFNAVITWLENHGWSNYDTITSGSRTVLRAVCKDGTSYKYVELNIDSSGIWVNGYESWNASTNVGTNQIQIGGGAGATYAKQQINLTVGGYLYLFATARYMIILGRTNSNSYGDFFYGTWSGFFEITKDSRDTRSIPSWGATNGKCLLGGDSSGMSSNIIVANSNYLSLSAVRSGLPSLNFNTFWVPRSLQGSTSSAANSQSTVEVAGMTVLPQYCNMWNYSTNATISLKVYGNATGNEQSLYIPNNYYANLVVNEPIYYRLPSSNNPVTNTPWAFSVNIVETYVASSSSPNQQKIYEKRGKLYGIKVLQQSVGSLFDTINIKVDADGNMDQNGTSTSHHILTLGIDSTVRYAIPA